MRCERDEAAKKNHKETQRQAGKKMETDGAECPLCMESLEIDDLNFYPCSCGYQICRFCWHRIRTDENGLCPACRKAYSEDPAIYRPLTQDEIARINKERKQREAQRKQKISENRKHLSNVRVIQKNLLFVVGLSQKLADSELLKRQDYFGKFGKIQKIVVNPSTNYAGPQGPSASAYITFSKEEETLRAILGVNNVHLYGRTIRASLGTTKYCTHYLRNTQCHKVDCMYLHEAGDESGSFTKEDMQQGKHQIYEKELLENYLKSIQNKRKSEDLEQFPQILGEDKEEWMEDDASGSHGSALPPKAAWADKEIKTQEDKMTPDIEEIDNFDTNTTMVEVPPAEHGVQDPASPEVASLDVFEMDEPYKPNEKPLHDDCRERLDKVSQPSFCAGWATSGQTATTNKYQEVATEDPGGGRPRISSWFDDGLGLNNLRVDADDDLGFDPFTESHRGLEEFIASNPDPYNSLLSGISSLYCTGGWNRQYDSSNHSSGVASSYLPASEYSLFGKKVSNTGSLFDVWGNMAPYSQESSTSVSLTGDGSKNASSLNAQSPQGGEQSDIKSWQDGLRALLPNINISFSASLDNSEEAKASRQNSRKDTPSSKPPPGFVQAEDQGDQGRLLQDSSIIWSKMRSEKEKNRSPPGLAMSQAQEQMYAAKVSQDTSLSGRSPPGASWNAIVSGQTGVSIPKSTQESPHVNKPVLVSPGSQGVKLSGVANSPVSGVGKPFGKPTTMFAVSSSQNTNKPTAKVKPLKCVVPSDDFLVPAVPVAPGGNDRKSGINDLDDIDFNDPLPSASVHIATRAVSDENVKANEENQGQASWKKSSKRKKKKKENGTKETGSTKQDPGVRSVSHAHSVSEGETKRTVLERPLSREAKDKTTQVKNGKTKVDEKFSGNGVSQQELKLGKSAEKVETRDILRPKEKPSEIKVAMSGAKDASNLEKQLPLSAKSTQQGMRVPGPRPPSQRGRGIPVPDSPPRPIAPIRILKSQPQPTGGTTTSTLAQSSSRCVDPNPLEMYDRESLGRLAESTKLLLQTVLSETEVIKSNTEQISKDLKAALDKCKDPPLTVSDLDKLNCLPLMEIKEELLAKQGDNSVIDTSDLEKQVESARREAKLLEVKLNDVIRKNMASDIETLRKKGPEPKQKNGKLSQVKK